jgi:hypothetical protein
MITMRGRITVRSALAKCQVLVHTSASPYRQRRRCEVGIRGGGTTISVACTAVDLVLESSEISVATKAIIVSVLPRPMGLAIVDRLYEIS